MNKRIAIVTGASSGVGKATALGLAQKGLHVIMHARHQKRGERARQDVVQKSGNPNVELMLADFAVQYDIRRFADEFANRYEHLHVLVNNAAIIPRKREVTPDGIEKQLAVNHLAYFLLTHLLLDHMRSTDEIARVVNVASQMHKYGNIDFNDLETQQGYGVWGWKQYANTKLINVIFTVELARRVNENNIVANSLHPGSVNTRLYRNLPLAGLFRWLLQSPQRGAQTPVYLATSSAVEGITGQYFENKSISSYNPAANDTTISERLWEVSAQLTGLA